VYVYIYIFIYTNIYIYIYIHTCICIYIYIYIYMYNSYVLGVLLITCHLQACIMSPTNECTQIIDMKASVGSPLPKYRKITSCTCIMPYCRIGMNCFLMMHFYFSIRISPTRCLLSRSTGRKFPSQNTVSNTSSNVKQARNLNLYVSTQSHIRRVMTGA